MSNSSWLSSPFSSSLLIIYLRNFILGDPSQHLTYIQLLVPNHHSIKTLNPFLHRFNSLPNRPRDCTSSKIMDSVDQFVSRAERDASPERFPDSSPTDAPKRLEQIRAPQDGTAHVEKQETRTSSGSTASSSTSSASIFREPIGMSRVNTQRDLERHPTELDRIETHRTQHGSTVGRTNTSRKSKKPLPNFGGGKVRTFLI